MDVALWVASGVLAAIVMMAGLTKALLPKSRLHEMGLTYVEDFSARFIRTLGWAEVAGAVGLILPVLTGVAPVLAAVAAICLAVTMVGAVVVHLRRGETSKVLMPLVLLALSVFVAWGRLT